MANQPELIVVGAPAFADILAKCGAQWKVNPAAQSVDAMWDAIESGALPGNVTAIVFTDGTASTPDELELSIAAFAPAAVTFVVADPSRGEMIINRARELAPSVDKGDPNAPIYFLPSHDLRAALAIMQQALIGQVAWASPVVQTPPPVAPVAPPVAPVAPPVAPVYVAPAPVVAPPVAPVVAPVAPVYVAPVVQAQPTYDPSKSAPVYSAQVSQQAAQKLAKRPDAIPGQVTIACMSSKGGSGKSTTAICLAGMIARSSAAAGEPKKVVVVDLDTRDGQLASLIGQYMPTAVTLRVMPVWDAPTVLNTLVHDKNLGIDALLAPVRPRNADDVGPDFYRQIIQVLQTTHDVVILDCSVNYLDSLLGVGFALADEILFVTTVATTSVEGMARALTELFADPEDGGLGIDRNKVGVVANQVINNVGMGKDKILRAALGAPLIGQIPAEYDVVLTATNQTRMGDLLKHPRLGVAYYKLATVCLPKWKLAPLVAETPSEPPSGSGAQKKRFGR